MKRSLTALLLSLCVLASLSGCASYFDKTYVSNRDYVPPSASPEGEASGARAVEDYLDLKIAINALVLAREDSGVIDFKNYEGDISADLAAACKEISNETALGVWCVDFIHYDLDRIVAYYEAKVNVIYKRTEEEVAALKYVNNSTGLYELLGDAMSEYEESLVVSVSATSIGAAEIEDFIDRSYFSSPLKYPNRPASTVEEFSAGGMQKIFRIDIDYGDGREALEAKCAALTEAVGYYSATAASDAPEYSAFNLASELVNGCASGEEFGGTAYDALLIGAASSEGMAMAYKALCDSLGIGCVVIEGRFDRVRHYWNIIELGGEHYHVDLSRTAEDGFSKTFLRDDDSMWGGYWWDNELYPVCAGELSYEQLFEPEPPAPPIQTEEPVPPTETPEPTPPADETPEPTPEPEAENGT